MAVTKGASERSQPGTTLLSSITLPRTHLASPTWPPRGDQAVPQQPLRRHPSLTFSRRVAARAGRRRCVRPAGKAATGCFPSLRWWRTGAAVPAFPGAPFVSGGRFRGGGTGGHQIQRRLGLIWWWRVGGAWMGVGMVVGAGRQRRWPWSARLERPTVAG
jgi:hypothetical protein